MKTPLLALALFLAAVPACKKDEAKAGGAPSQDRPAHTDATRFAIAVTENGFEPDDVSVPAAKPVTLVFERKTDVTCAKEVVVDVGDQKIRKDLPLNTPVELAVTFPKAGKLTYACGMDMIKGTVTVQ